LVEIVDEVVELEDVIKVVEILDVEDGVEILDIEVEDEVEVAVVEDLVEVGGASDAEPRLLFAPVLWKHALISGAVGVDEEIFKISGAIKYKKDIANCNPVSPDHTDASQKKIIDVSAEQHGS